MAWKSPHPGPSIPAPSLASLLQMVGHLGLATSSVGLSSSLEIGAPGPSFWGCLEVRGPSAQCVDIMLGTQLPAPEVAEEECRPVKGQVLQLVGLRSFVAPVWVLPLDTPQEPADVG